MMKTSVFLLLSTWIYPIAAIPTRDNYVHDKFKLSPSPLSDYAFDPRTPSINRKVIYETKTRNCSAKTAYDTEHTTKSVNYHQISVPPAKFTHETRIFPTHSKAYTFKSIPTKSPGTFPTLHTPSGKPRPTGACSNDRDTRRCWGNYGIDTDCEREWPSTGVVVEYWLTVENNTLSPDGFERQVLTFNGTIPGPLITANWGDTIKVHVKNNLLNNGTSVHWHGFRQLNSNNQDGTNGITECPIAPGKTKTYEFQATTYGTTWYHSHFSAQYGDGVVGPIIIHGPASADYDEDLGPIMVQDWYHQTIFETEYYAQHIGPPKANNYLLNGINAPVNSRDGNRFTLKFKRGKKYLLRLINASTDNFFRIGIDGHKFTVIANDLIPIRPFETDTIPMGVGQRYDVIVEATAEVGNYWFRAVNSLGCGSNENTGLGIANGIVEYEGASNGHPDSTPGNYSSSCHDLPSRNLVPIVRHSVDKAGFEIGSENTLAVGVPDKAITAYSTDPVFIWSLDGVAIDVDWENPTLLKLQNGISDFSPVENVIRLDKVNSWTYWIIQNKFRIAHPMHLHGHDFSCKLEVHGSK